MQNRGDRFQVHNQVQSMPTLSPKKIGCYLVDAGLLTAAQISVALNDQQSTGMRFGEIVVARGWLKEQTVEWIMSKVVEPERQAIHRHQQAAYQRSASQQASNRWSNQGAHSVLQPPATQAKPGVAQSSQPTLSASTGRMPVSRMPDSATRKPADKPTDATAEQPTPQTDKPTAAINSKFIRREAPISKPLPSVNSSDGDVNWVG
ncbi:MAG: hypothetical protein HC827_03970 [Cyanobacteria bacterium RM1_2_2]|nr:hypothetical protein [Cyanobacteria bacterium RM1_2_2]